MDKLGQNIGDTVKTKLDAFKNADPNQKAIALTIFALIISILVVTTFWMNRVNYKVLYRDLAMEDAGEIAKILKDKKINYKLEDDGKTILVPSDQLYQLRLDLAGQGLPKNGQLGFELFDKTDFQSSEFAENIKYQRALQGELTETINHLDAVDDSRVNLTIPKRSVYLDEGNPATASVVLKLKPGRTLSDEEVRGITQLVASCVEGLKAENVTVMSTDGKLLSDFIQESNYGATNYQLKIQKQIQAQVEQKIQSTLNSVLGPGKAVVNAHVDIKMDKKAIQKEIYQPAQDNAGVIRSTQTMLENYDSKPGAPVPVRAPGALPLQPQSQAQATTGPGVPQYKQQSQTTNYEVSKVLESETINPGQITRLSVGVIIDATANLTPQQVSDLSQVISSVSGIDTRRGDELTVKTIKFNPQQFEETKPREGYAALLEKYGPLAALALSPFLILVVLLILMMKGKKKKAAGDKDTADRREMEERRADSMSMPTGTRIDVVSSDLSMPADPYATVGAGSYGGMNAGGYKADGADPQEAIRNFARENPRLVAALFEKWVSEE